MQSFNEVGMVNTRRPLPRETPRPRPKAPLTSDVARAQSLHRLHQFVHKQQGRWRSSPRIHVSDISTDFGDFTNVAALQYHHRLINGCQKLEHGSWQGRHLCDGVYFRQPLSVVPDTSGNRDNWVGGWRADWRALSHKVADDVASTGTLCPASP
jgi:hypothetical protein